MRILLTTPYDLAVPGGVNRHALDLLAALTERGHAAKLVGPSSAPVFEGDPRIMRVGGIWRGALNGAVSRITLDARIAGSVRRLLRSFAPDVVHVQEPFVPMLNAWVLLMAGGARRVGTFHTYSEHSRGYLWSWPWCDAMNGMLDARVAVSEAAREFAEQFHPADYRVIPNGVRLPAEADCRPVAAPGTPLRVLFVGRAAEPRKGFDVLRAAMAELHRDVPGAFALTVAGPDELDLPGLPCRWLGAVTESGLHRAYAEADVVVVPSTGGESFGLVPLEALAHRVPVIVSAIRGYADWLAGRPGVRSFPPGDAAALAAELRELARDPAGHLALARGAAGTAARYDFNRTCDRLLALYSR